MLGKPDERTDHRAVAATVLGDVAGAPGYSSIRLLAVVEGAVPTIKDVAREVFSLVEILLLAGSLVSFDQLADEPFVVVVDVHHSLDFGSALGIASVHSVYAPFLGLRVGSQCESALIIVAVVHQVRKTLGVFCVIFVVKF
jgi:hypothetical protein